MSGPVQHLDLVVDAAPTAAREARHAVARRGLVSSGREPMLLLLVSELVSDSVRRWGRVPAKRAHDDALEPGGLGLVLVDEMADRWGVACTDHRTCVWFELACA